MSSLILNDLSVTTKTGDLLLDNVGLQVNEGEIVGLVGESGSGKSMTSLALTGLLPDGLRASSGNARLGEDQFLVDGCLTRRPKISLVFQNARAALHPTMRIGDQVARLLRSRGRRNGLETATEELLSSVGIVDPERVRRAYPHQLSGGMNQRVMIALGLASEPELLIADEPTTGLDVTVQAQILELLQRTSASTGRGILFITHDLGVVAQMCHRVVVLYQGKIVESGKTDDIFHNPTNDYTRGLIASASSDIVRTHPSEVKQ